MNEYDSQRPKPWNFYTSSNPSHSQPEIDREAPWKNFGTSMNAISFGFVATAILVSMFLIMAIFEHLFRRTASFSSPQDMNSRSLESGSIHKLRNLQTVSHLPSEFNSFLHTWAKNHVEYPFHAAVSRLYELMLFVFLLCFLKSQRFEEIQFLYSNFFTTFWIFLTIIL